MASGVIQKLEAQWLLPAGAKAMKEKELLAETRLQAETGEEIL